MQNNLKIPLVRGILKCLIKSLSYTCKHLSIADDTVLWNGLSCMEKHTIKSMLAVRNCCDFFCFVCLFVYKIVFECLDLISRVFPALSCCLLHLWSHPEGRCRTESVPLHVGDTWCVHLAIASKQYIHHIYYTTFYIVC